MQHNPTVFLIDDDSDDQEIFSHALEKANQSVECVFANDGIHALEKIRSDENFIPDFIFIDMNMPRMNGQQCLAEIKKIERLRNVPVYMYSTSADPESIEENKRLGAADFIVKPSNIQDLIRILADIIKRPVFAVLLCMLTFGLLPEKVVGQERISKVTELKKLSVEELMNIVVISVSKTPENLSEVASAIQVVTGNDVRRSAAVRLPEALRLAPNLQVTQSGSHDWGISARGFNGAPVAASSLADKLLVMIDGRTVYTPLFGGVFWDVQNILLEDVERIEVVSGPGGTLWGSNAVNGVINVLTKGAEETLGFFGSVSYGSLLEDQVALRYGSHIDSTLYFRVYGQHFDYGNSLLADGNDARDSWEMTQGGFRMDYYPSDRNHFTLQGELYSGAEDDTLSTFVNGQHILGKWITHYSERSNMVIQTYFDRTWRDIRNSPFTDDLITFDLEWQQGFPVGDVNQFLVGAGYRLQEDKTTSFNNRFTPADKTIRLFSAFIQDQISLVPEKLSLTIGSKFLHNEYTGFEFQPSGRLAWTPVDIHTLWAAASRTVRTPSRFDVDLTSFTTFDHPAFISENVITYELGYRMRPYDKISFSLSVFYNQYDDLRSINITPAGNFYFGNDLEATSWGFELSANTIVSDWWRLRGGITLLEKEFIITDIDVFPGSELIEGIDPRTQMLVQSIMDISTSIQFDLIGRYVDSLPEVGITNTPSVPSFIELDARLAWEHKFLTVSLSGQNLLTDSHREFGTRRIPRNVHGTISIRL